MSQRANSSCDEVQRQDASQDLFIDWISHFVIHSHASLQNQILLILDNRPAHISLEAYRNYIENGIHMVSIPPHTSNYLHPLNVSFLEPLKAEFQSQYEDYKKIKDFD